MAEEDDSTGSGGEKKFKAYTAADLQKIRLEKLMANIDKPIEIPTTAPRNEFTSAPEFVRNAMGSSAGAGSGEFHVYRNLRRKEYARLHYIENQAKMEKLDAQYQMKLEQNKRKAQEATAKRRAKRLKKKEKMKAKKSKQPEKSETKGSAAAAAAPEQPNTDADIDDDSKSTIEN